jgi:hypothetical protein
MIKINYGAMSPMQQLHFNRTKECPEEFIIGLYDPTVDEMYGSSDEVDVEYQHKKTTIENRAKEIYATWKDMDQYVPWVERGNSLKQDEARRIARIEYETSNR